MPFDGTIFDPWSARRNEKEIALIKAMQRLFVSEDHWMRGDWHDNLKGGRSCILHAYDEIRMSLHIHDDEALPFISRAVNEHHPTGTIMDFNDNHCSGFSELHDMLALALLLAGNFCPSMLPPARETWSYDAHETARNRLARLMGLSPTTRHEVVGQRDLFCVASL